MGCLVPKTMLETDVACRQRPYDFSIKARRNLRRRVHCEILRRQMSDVTHRTGQHSAIIPRSSALPGKYLFVGGVFQPENGSRGVPSRAIPLLQFPG
jgi:hypothetical protein